MAGLKKGNRNRPALEQSTPAHRLGFCCADWLPLPIWNAPLPPNNPLAQSRTDCHMANHLWMALETSIQFHESIRYP
jgi:hypothetical protein